MRGGRGGGVIVTIVACQNDDRVDDSGDRASDQGIEPQSFT